MKHGDIVLVNGRKAIALRITQKDIDHGTDVKVPGVYAFAGYWYGTNPLTVHAYGKILRKDLPGYGITIGRVKNHEQVKALNI